MTVSEFDENAFVALLDLGASVPLNDLDDEAGLLIPTLFGLVLVGVPIIELKSSVSFGLWNGLKFGFRKGVISGL